MFQLVVFVALVSVTLGGLLPVPSSLDQRIIGGEPAPIDYAPYIVSISVDYTGTGGFRHFCGGVIITKNAILTTAQCTKYPGNTPKIRAGSAINNAGGVERNIRKTVRHEFFYGELDYDYAIVFLDEDLPLQTGSSATIATIPMAPEGSQVIPGSKATVYGWGSIVEGGPVQESLRFVEMPVVDQGVCETLYTSIAKVTRRMLCAGNIGSGGVDACYGDAGGPLVVSGILRGLSSWGFGCAKPNYPGVFSRVSEARDWIDRTLADDAMLRA